MLVDHDIRSADKDIKGLTDKTVMSALKLRSAPFSGVETLHAGDLAATIDIALEDVRDRAELSCNN